MYLSWVAVDKYWAVFDVDQLCRDAIYTLASVFSLVRKSILTVRQKQEL
jgi:hypothetical protein